MKPGVCTFLTFQISMFFSASLAWGALMVAVGVGFAGWVRGGLCLGNLFRGDSERAATKGSEGRRPGGEKDVEGRCKMWVRTMVRGEGGRSRKDAASAGRFGAWACV
jgi:hypothetical protein